MIPEIDHPASGDIHQQRVGLDVAGQPAEALEVGPELVEPLRWRGVQRGEGAGTQNTIVLQGMLRLEALECFHQHGAVTVVRALERQRGFEIAFAGQTLAQQGYARVAHSRA